MSEVSSGAWSVAFKFIDKFISDYGIWLWLLTFLLILIVANKIGFVALDSFGHRNVDIVFVGALFAFCMLMNALSVHVHILSFFRSIVAGIEGAMVSRFRLKEAKRNFQQIMKTDCRERDWLVWYIFVYEKNNRYRPYKLFSKVIEGRTITYGDYYGYKWNDDIAHWLLGCYYIFYTIPESDIFYHSVDRELIFKIRSRFNLFKQLNDISIEDVATKDSIRNVIAIVKDLTGADISDFRKKKAFFEVNKGSDPVDDSKARDEF